MQERCRKNWIYCSGCLLWVYKMCSDISGRIAEDPDFRCNRCLGKTWAIDGGPCVGVQFSDTKLDAVEYFV